MLHHFLILRKREFHIISHPLAARESKLQQSELQRIYPRRKKPAEAGLLISNGAGERT